MSNTDASGEKRVTGTSERREQIIQRLRQQGSVQVNDLSALYGVSTVTVSYTHLFFTDFRSHCCSPLLHFYWQRAAVALAAGISH